MMDWEAQQALVRLVKTGQITLVVQDNGPIHTSILVQERIRVSASKGLYLFFLPKYCSEMNLI